MDVNVKIQPAVSPFDRGDIEDAVTDELGGAGEVIDGGTMLDGSECDFTIEIFEEGYSMPRLVGQLRSVLRKVEFTQPTKITFKIGNQTYQLEEA